MHSRRERLIAEILEQEFHGPYVDFMLTRFRPLWEAKKGSDRDFLKTLDAVGDTASKDAQKKYEELYGNRNSDFAKRYPPSRENLEQRKTSARSAAMRDCPPEQIGEAILERFYELIAKPDKVLTEMLDRSQTVVFAQQSYAENWRQVDVLAVRHAAALWCNKDPTEIPGSDSLEKLPADVAAIEQMLSGEISAGRLPANLDGNVMASIGSHTKSLVSRSDLQKLAAQKGNFPHFLVDEIVPDQTGGEKTVVDESREALISQINDLTQEVGLLTTERDELANKVDQLKSVIDPEEALSPKARNSLRKLVLGMAIEKYRYDRSASKSNAPANILRTLENVQSNSDYDLTLDKGTILTQLRSAADELKR